MKRYHRQMILPQVGAEGQAAFGRARVLVVGAGGLGTPAALYLAAAGVGEIGIVDGDVIDESNLHRQVLYTEGDVGGLKALVLCEKLARMNPGTVFNAVPRRLNRELAHELFALYDVIVDGTDNFAAKYLINDVALVHGRPVVYGALSQFDGRVSVFWKGRGPCYRCLHPRPPRVFVENCAQAGVLGPLPGIIGCLQAMETLKTLLAAIIPRSPAPLLGVLAIHDFASNRCENVPIRKRAGCLCAREAIRIEEIAELESQACPHAPGVLERAPQGVRVLDVRDAEEWADYHLQDSLHWPLEKLMDGDFPPSSVGAGYLLVCRSGARARRGAALMKAGGFANVSSFQGSIYEYPYRK